MLKKFRKPKEEITPARREWLAPHINYLREQLESNADKPDVLSRLTARLIAAEDELDGV
jgi:hypothetical protein